MTGASRRARPAGGVWHSLRGSLLRKLAEGSRGVPRRPADAGVGRRGRRALPAPSLRRRSARLSSAGPLSAADRHPDPRRRRPPDGRVRAGEADLRAGRGDPQAPDPGLPRRRGQELLQPFGGRPARHRPRGADQPLAPRREPPAGRRLDHHPAGRQELPAERRGLAVAQDQGGAAGVPDRAGVHQGPDPRAVPERDLSRPRLLRRGGGGAQLLRQVAG